jgi:metal-responsive CopG/Arc/MetJ family transcriptional regulator
MAKSINVRPKKRGRPVTERAPIIGVRLSDDLLLDLDQWAVDHELSRSAAIRKLLERALRVPAKKS